MVSKYSGTCKRCGNPIVGGTDEITKVDGFGWVHATCPASVQPAPVVPSSVGATASKPALEEGIYEVAGEIYKAKFNKAHTHMYAERLVHTSSKRILTDGTEVEQVDFEFEYAPGAIKTISPADKMPIERAKDLCIKYGKCLRCRRSLKVAESVERGLGPVCVKYFGGA